MGRQHCKSQPQHYKVQSSIAAQHTVDTISLLTSLRCCTGGSPARYLCKLHGHNTSVQCPPTTEALWSFLDTVVLLCPHLCPLSNVSKCRVYSIHHLVYSFSSTCATHLYTYNINQLAWLYVSPPPPPPRCAISHYFCICATIATFCYPALRLIWHSVLYLSHTTTYNVNDKFWQYSFNVIQQSMLLWTHYLLLESVSYQMNVLRSKPLPVK